MSLDSTTVLRIARLARIGVNETVLQTLPKELNSILQWIDQLNEVDVEGVEPMVGTEQAGLRLREDKVTDGECREEVISNAPDRIDAFYTVPKVVE
ncbi:Asp-tRNA(Asn)/Glu-tRNA(Gln) amidotransferase subunit GatC [Entomobacter blattae]|uniref:Aspartyl/glutamyl-tRNA(Asn/Gln) amidotransferase subunit C n=1 Tax=Entomobacter blattae TaxID=2762277 RepID=A0A7H1NS45_9PROT|nr:Asp-tRNA(Asn)/Glu-tRNA(Gln) amidotransferase subunit GatC [Entomobacter blattae]QNT78605.1 Glutamyl-tRNA(Gln) amidotransferase subunit C [Entomobacter blattae]